MTRKVLWWALRCLGIVEWAVHVTRHMYSNARSRMRVNGQYSEEFGMGVVVHQSFVLSPLLFILVLEALSHEFRTGVPYGSSFMLMTWGSSLTPKRSVFSTPGRGTLAWKLKGYVSTWRRPSSWSLVMARMSCRNLTSTPLLSALVVSAEIASCAHSICCGSTRRSVA